MRFFFIGILIVFGSCKKFVEVPLPRDQFMNETVFSNDKTATAALTGIYSEMMNNASQLTSGFTTLYAGMAADELYYYAPSNRDEFRYNQITEANHSNLASYFWLPAYKYIYSANLCLEALSGAEGLTPSVKTALMGEAKFLRAFHYFYLVNLFGDVPLLTHTGYAENALLPRASAASIYQQIVKDLTEAYASLPAADPALEKVRPDKGVAAAFLARVYLYLKDWEKADQWATTVIHSGAYRLNEVLTDVFLKNSSEAIWQLMPVNPRNNTWEGNLMVAPTNTAAPTYVMTDHLMQSFESGDKRKGSWTRPRLYRNQSLYTPYKYKVFGNNAPITEYYTVFRLAEQYLIRAEARAQSGNLTGAREDLNTIRRRAGLGDKTTVVQPTLLMDIEQERRVELFAEWGHRWLDLKRTKRADEVLAVLKPATWQPTDALWPIPQDQILQNPRLTQNPGY